MSEELIFCKNCNNVMVYPSGQVVILRRKRKNYIQCQICNAEFEIGIEKSKN